MPTLMGIREYARHRTDMGQACSHPAVIRAIKDGRITKVLKDGKEWIDADIADQQWIIKTDPEQSLRGRSQSKSPDPIGVTGTTYEQAKVELLLSQKRQNDLKEAQALGVLVRADELTKTMGQRIVAAREQLMNIPYRLAATLAAETDQSEIVRILQREIRQSLADVASKEFNDADNNGETERGDFNQG